MRFEWDKLKNQANVKKHGLDFADAHLVFEVPMLIGLDTRQDYGEDRWIGIGLMGIRMVVLVFSEPQENTIRVISFRKATLDEGKQYEKTYKNEFGTF